MLWPLGLLAGPGEALWLLLNADSLRYRERSKGVPESKYLVLDNGEVIGVGARSCTSSNSTKASFAQTSTEIKVAGSELRAKEPQVRCLCRGSFRYNLGQSNINRALILVSFSITVAVNIGEGNNRYCLA